jgi:hypothetical protein
MRHTAVTAVLLLTVACTADRAQDWWATVDTLPSGVIHVVNSERGRWGLTPPWQLVEVAKIGTRFDSGPALFGYVADIGVDALGRIYVVDPMVQEILVFEPDGAYIRTIGRPGRGPGEFGGLTGIAFDPQGRLWALNQNNGRFSVFDTSGALLAEYPRRISGVAYARWENVFGEEGYLLEVMSYVTPTGLGGGLAKYDPVSMQYLDTLPTPRLPEDTPPLTGRRLLTEDGWWVGVQHKYRLWLLTHEGDTVRVIERLREAEALSRAERDSARRQEEQLRRRVVSGSLDMETETRPIFHSLAADEEGYLWVTLVSAPEEDRTRLDVFDREGVYLGQLTAPHRLDPLTNVVIKGGRLHYVTKDELDVPYVVAAEIRGRY